LATPDASPPLPSPGAIRLRPMRPLKVNATPRGRRRLPPIDVGERLGRLTVTGHVTVIRGKSRVMLVCRCDCGASRHLVRVDVWREGTSKSCGCLRAEIARKWQLARLATLRGAE